MYLPKRTIGSWFACPPSLFSHSVEAALALEANGYTNVYNVVGGFEGGTDTKGYRTKAAGWKNLGFPYTFGFTGNIDESVPGN